MSKMPGIFRLAISSQKIVINNKVAGSHDENVQLEPTKKHISLLRWSIALTSLLSLFLAIAPMVNAQPLEKPKVAILTPSISEKITKTNKTRLNIEKLQSEMEASFLAARKFDVVTRNSESLKVIRDEQKFAESDFAAGNAAQTGALDNANYLIRSQVNVFSFYSIIKKVPNLQSKYFRTDHGLMEINTQVLDTTTGQVTATFDLKSSFASDKWMVNSKYGSPSPEKFTKLAKDVSGQMVDQFLDLVFPVMIIKVSGDTVYLNRGKDGGFKKGMVLNVYYPGESLIDPYTGDDLGSAEEYIGKITVDRINPKLTTAKIVTDSIEGEISTGCIIRKP